MKYGYFPAAYYVKNYKVINKRAIIPRKDQPQVSFYSHGSLFSWLIVPALWAKTMCEQGFSDYKSSILFHPLVYKTPILKTFGHLLAGGCKIVSPKEAIAALNTGLIEHIGTMPEASNCLYKYNQPIGPLKYNGLISIGLATKSRFLLVVHKGTEVWNKIIDFPLSYKGRKGFFLPLPIKRLENVIVHFSIYKPRLALKDIKGVTKKERIRLENIEGERMRNRMIEIHNSL